jgi:excisionase family DNA binding protein
MDAHTPKIRSTRRGWEAEQGTRQPLLISKRQTAELLNLCLRTVDYLIAAKELAAIRVGKRVLVKYASVLAFTRKDHIDGAQPNGEAVQ